MIILINIKSTKFCQDRLGIKRFIHRRKVVPFFLLHGGPVWARERCRISPPRFLAECCKRQLNRGSFVLLYLGCLLFLICIEFVYLYFPVLFCLSVSVK